MKFTKMHGLGNDFIVIEDFNCTCTFKKVSQLAKELCDRHFGIGADGLVLLQPSQKAQFRMRIINSDGSEAEMCGNALRCVGKYLYEKGYMQNTVLTVETFHHVKTLRLELDAHHRVTKVEVDMGEPVLDSDRIPVTGERRRVISENIMAAGETFPITAVSMGNPHCVIFCDSTESVPLTQWGPVLEKHELFPQKTNVEFVEILSVHEARFRVWERGAGSTLACGTGACAVLVAGVLTGRLARRARLHLPGGSLLVEWRENNHIYLTGPAAEVFQGVIT